MKRINIRPEDARFYVNKEKRKITCIINVSDHFVYDFLWGFDEMDGFGGFAHEVYNTNTVFVGIATCAEGDTWNEELGKRIAFSRAKLKLFRDFFKNINKFFNVIDKNLNSLEKKCNALGEIWAHNLDYIQNEIDQSLVENEKETKE